MCLVVLLLLLHCVLSSTAAEVVFPVSTAGNNGVCLAVANLTTAAKQLPFDVCFGQHLSHLLVSASLRTTLSLLFSQLGCHCLALVATPAVCVQFASARTPILSPFVMPLAQLSAHCSVAWTRFWTLDFSVHDRLGIKHRCSPLFQHASCCHALRRILACGAKILSS